VKGFPISLDWWGVFSIGGSFFIEILSVSNFLLLLLNSKSKQLFLFIGVYFLKK